MVSANSGSACHKIARRSRKVRMTFHADSNAQRITVMTVSVQNNPLCPLSEEISAAIPCCNVSLTIARPSTNHTGAPAKFRHHCHVACNISSLRLAQVFRHKNASPSHSSAIASIHVPRQKRTSTPGSNAIQPSSPGRHTGSYGAWSGISAAAG